MLRNHLSALVQDRLLKKSNLKNYNDATPEARSLTRGLLLQMFHEVKQDGARFIVVVIPNVDLTSNFPFSKEESQALGMTVIDGRDFVGKDDYYPRDGHWKPSAHRKAAETLTSLLTSDQYLAQSR